MASIGAIAKRRANAVARLEAATARLVGEFGVAMPAPVPGGIAQPDLRQAMEIERLADLLEAILGSTPVAEVVDESKLDGTISDVVAYLDTVTSFEVLNQLASTEADGKGRKGVLNAIEARRTVLASGE